MLIIKKAPGRLCPGAFFIQQYMGLKKLVSGPFFSGDLADYPADKQKTAAGQ